MCVRETFTFTGTTKLSKGVRAREREAPDRLLAFDRAPFEGVRRYDTALVVGLQGYLAHKKRPPRYDHHRAHGIGLPQGPRGGLFRMSEVTL